MKQDTMCMFQITLVWLQFQCHAQLGELKWECLTEQRKDTEMSYETWDYWNFVQGVQEQLAGTRLHTDIMDRKGTVYTGWGDKVYMSAKKGMWVYYSALCFARRDQSCRRQTPQGTKRLSRGFPPNKMFPLVRQAWIWPAPGHQHTIYLAYCPKEEATWTLGYSGTKGGSACHHNTKAVLVRIWNKMDLI